MLYGWELTQMPPREIADLYWKTTDATGEPLSPSARQFAERLVQGTVDHLEAIDPLIEARAENWRLSRMAVIDRLILRLAVFELAYDRESPPKVVMDEALELARTFSEADAIGFINGVLDAVQHALTDPKA